MEQSEDGGVEDAVCKDDVWVHFRAGVLGIFGVDEAVDGSDKLVPPFSQALIVALGVSLPLLAILEVSHVYLCGGINEGVHVRQF